MVSNIFQHKMNHNKPISVQSHVFLLVPAFSKEIEVVRPTSFRVHLAQGAHHARAGQILRHRTQHLRFFIWCFLFF